MYSSLLHSYTLEIHTRPTRVMSCTLKDIKIFGCARQYKPYLVLERFTFWNTPLGLICRNWFWAQCRSGIGTFGHFWNELMCLRTHANSWLSHKVTGSKNYAKEHLAHVPRLWKWYINIKNKKNEVEFKTSLSDAYTTRRCFFFFFHLYCTATQDQTLVVLTVLVKVLKEPRMYKCIWSR